MGTMKNATQHFFSCFTYFCFSFSHDVYFSIAITRSKSFENERKSKKQSITLCSRNLAYHSPSKALVMKSAMKNESAALRFLVKTSNATDRKIETKFPFKAFCMRNSHAPLLMGRTTPIAVSSSGCVSPLLMIFLFFMKKEIEQFQFWQGDERRRDSQRKSIKFQW
jgi:hypothetical protein